MGLKLYALDLSPAVRSVMLTAKAIGLDLEIINTDLGKNEQMKPEFLAKNPQHCVPTLEEEDGFIIWDSHTIMCYLVDKYTNGSIFYPKNLRQRAIIHNRLFLDTTLSVYRGTAIIPIFYEGLKTVPQKIADTIKENYNFIENFLSKTKWVARDDISIADFSLIPTITTCSIVVPIEEIKYPRITQWIAAAEKWPYYEENRIGHEKLKRLVYEQLNKN